MLRLIYLLIALLPFTSYAGNSEIDYAHKSLNKEILKKWNLDINALLEIQVHSKLPYTGKFFSTPSSSNKYIFVGRVNSCRVGGCTINKANYGPSEFFDYFILFDKNGKVEFVKIYNYAATHGHEVMAKGWLKQFQGYDNKSTLEVGKNVDSISGATISVHAITEDVVDKTNLLHSYINNHR